MTDASVSLTDYLELAVQCSDEGLFLVDSDHQVIYCNPAMETLIGLEKDQVVGKPYLSLFNQVAQWSQDSDRIEHELEFALDSCEQRPVVHLLLRYPLTGRLQIQLFPLIDPLGTHLGWGGQIRDVTWEWREISQRMKHISGLISEMRIFLAGITGFAAALLNNYSIWDTEECHHFVENIYEGIIQMTQFLENAHDLFKLQLGEVSLERRPTVLKQLMQDTIRRLGLKAYNHQISLTIPDDLPLIEIDPQRVQQVIRNILNNATRRSPAESTIQLVVTSSSEEVTISITDQGVAIDGDSLTRVIEPFNRTDTKDIEQVTSTRMELYAAYQLILAHGGQMRVENSEQRGTTIHCVLPIHASPAKRAKATKPASIAPPKERSVTRTRRSFPRTLLVDDDPQILQLWRLVLEKESYQVVMAKTGKQALEIAATKHPQVILLDLHLPDMDGLTVCARLREFTSVPIIIVTAYANPEITLKALEIGADDYLIKPISPNELLARMRAILRRVSNTGNGDTKPSIQIGNLWIDHDQHQVKVNGKPIKLTPIEFKVLYVLARNAGHVLSHAQLLEMIWGPDCEGEKEYLWVHVNHLRKKLEDDPKNPQYVLTEPSVGYYLPAVTDPSMLFET